MNFELICDRLSSSLFYTPVSKIAGTGKGLGKGATWLLKLQMYHIMKFHNLDPDSHAAAIPDNYMAKNFSLEDLDLAAKTGAPKKQTMKTMYWVRMKKLFLLIPILTRGNTMKLTQIQI